MLEVCKLPAVLRLADWFLGAMLFRVCDGSVTTGSGVDIRDSVDRAEAIVGAWLWLVSREL